MVPTHFNPTKVAGDALIGAETVADRKRRLIRKALAILVAAGELNERDSADFDEFAVKFYLELDAVCLSVEQVMGKLRVEIARRLGEAIIAEDERRGGDQRRDGRATLKPLTTKERQARSRAATICSRPKDVDEYVKKVLAKGNVPSVSAAAAYVKAADQAANPKALDLAARNVSAVKLAKKIAGQLDAKRDKDAAKELRAILDGARVGSPSLVTVIGALKKTIEDAKLWLVEVEHMHANALEDEAVEKAEREALERADAAADDAAHAVVLARGETGASATDADAGLTVFEAMAEANPPPTTYHGDHTVAAE